MRERTPSERGSRESSGTSESRSWRLESGSESADFAEGRAMSDHNVMSISTPLLWRSAGSLNVQCAPDISNT